VFAEPRWYAVWTRSHCEQLASAELAARGFDTFLPKAIGWTRRGGGRTLAPHVLFPGYFFVHHPLDKAACVQILKARGVVRLLGERWDRLTPIPDDEIVAIRRMVTSGSPVFRHRLMADGDPVRIIGGPLTGLQGRFLRARPTKGLFVVSVSLLQRSVAIEVDATQVEAA
jgi:transcription antitermination factor NusG